MQMDNFICLNDFEYFDSTASVCTSLRKYVIRAGRGEMYSLPDLAQLAAPVFPGSQPPPPLPSAGSARSAELRDVPNPLLLAN